jgi:hypothetical protein
VRVLWLLDVLKEAGLNVQAVAGWQDRGVELEAVDCILWHHDAVAGPADMPSLKILVNGRPDLPGPLCQAALGRSGKWYVVAAGKANHAGAGIWRGVNHSARTIGIEAANDGLGEPWPDAQVDSYVEGTAAILRHLGLTADAVCGHKEWALPKGRKVDPRYLDMEQARQRIHWALNPPTSEVTPMFDPPPRIAAGCVTPDGKGAWLVTPEGAIFTVGAAPFFGGAFERDYFVGKVAAQIAPNSSVTSEGYVVTATSGETYSFPEA